MKFPGSKLLFEFDLATRSMPLDELLRSCRQVGLTGFAELKAPAGVGMIFYYLGSEANALYREGDATYHGGAALEQLRSRIAAGEGMVGVYELPLDMAHLLRGITNRRKLEGPLGSKPELEQQLERLEVAEHTGTLEIQTREGAAMILLIGGRVSNCYWETSGGLTFEKGDARKKLEEALAKGRQAAAFVSEFSQVVWKSRHEVESSVRSRLEGKPGPGAAAELLAEETAARREILERLAAEVPAMMQAFFFDLMTGAVLAKKGRGTDALRVGLLADKVPPLTLYLRDLVAASHDDQVEVVEFQTARTSTLVAIVPEAQEAIAVLADKSQPTALIGSTLQRAVRSYAARQSPARGGVAAR